MQTVAKMGLRMRCGGGLKWSGLLSTPGLPHHNSNCPLCHFAMLSELALLLVQCCGGGLRQRPSCSPHTALVHCCLGTYKKTLLFTKKPQALDQKITLVYQKPRNPSQTPTPKTKMYQKDPKSYPPPPKTKTLTPPGRKTHHFLPKKSQLLPKKPRFSTKPTT